MGVETCSHFNRASNDADTRVINDNFNKINLFHFFFCDVFDDTRLRILICGSAITCWDEGDGGGRLPYAFDTFANALAVLGTASVRLADGLAQLLPTSFAQGSASAASV
jgi:hypothetical protein